MPARGGSLVSHMPDATAELLVRAVEAKKNGELDLARSLLSRAVELLREESDQIALAQALRDLGEVERSLPATDAGVAAYEEAVAIFKQQGAELKLAHAVRHLGDIQRHLGNLQQAAESYETALSLYRKHPEASRLDFANCLRGAALLREKTSERLSAMVLWREAIMLYEEVGIAQGVEEGSRRIASLRLVEEEPRQT